MKPSGPRCGINRRILLSAATLLPMPALFRGTYDETKKGGWTVISMKNIGSASLPLLELPMSLHG